MEKRIEKVLNDLQALSERQLHDLNNVPIEDQVICVGPETGQLLNTLTRSMNAKKLVEIGTSYGYSAIWFAEALQHTGGRLISIDNNQNKIHRATENLRKVGLAKFVKLVQSDALRAIKKLSGKIDICLIDANKEEYPKYFELIFPKMRKHGLIVADNILYPENFREITQKYVAYVKSYDNVHTVTVPIGNGEEITIKL